MENFALFLGLLSVGIWFAGICVIYWFVFRKAVRELDKLDARQRLELLKTRRQRHLK